MVNEIRLEKNLPEFVFSFILKKKVCFFIKDMCLFTLMMLF